MNGNMVHNPKTVLDLKMSLGIGLSHQQNQGVFNFHVYCETEKIKTKILHIVKLLLMEGQNFFSLGCCCITLKNQVCSCLTQVILLGT